ncbi:type VI immunity family protein [Acinetobacter sp. TUM15131]|uniref:type VI immunity family protein n=1 Tax=Acinetobacter sp. TUM15131 TaxID=2609141 RepID=UPI00124E811D|nr:type VI immunity family protein [Acinetobacter sp. TUM15131]
MSTAEIFLSEDEIKNFLDEFSLDSDYMYGYEQEEFGICTFITFYILNNDEEILSIADKILSICCDFETQIIDKPLSLIYTNKNSIWKKLSKNKLSKEDIILDITNSVKSDLFYFIGASSADSNQQSAQWAYSGMLSQTNAYSYLKLTFSEKWYKNNKSKWNKFVEKSLNELNPIQSYSGYEIGNSTQLSSISPEFETAERVFADYFYGLDIDHPAAMAFHSHYDEDGFEYLPVLGAGLRTPTWSFLLSPYWIEKLGLNEEEIRLKLKDLRIKIIKLPDAANPEKFSLWIQLGELSLYPIEDGIPDLLVRANDLIKPIRCDNLKLTTLDAWDDDPNPRFDIESSPKWIARFDKESSWPEGKRVNKVSNLSLEEEKFKIKGGELCPQTGYWQTPAQPDSRQYFKQGEIVPALIELDWGEVYWYWDGEK